MGVGFSALVALFILGFYLASQRPLWTRVDTYDYCLGWRFAYPIGYCGGDETCRVRAPGCPKDIPAHIWWDTSLVAGAKAGEVSGMAAGGRLDDEIGGSE